MSENGTGPPSVAEEDLIPISGLQHVVFCERQFALIHVEQAWVENVLTVEGRQLHERVDAECSESRRDVRTARGVQLRCLRLGLVGRADVVEFRADPGGVPMLGWRGAWRPYPVEYKRGRPKAHRADEVQLCAQALCLEEMLRVAIPGGALFYGTPRRRTEVAFDDVLRDLVESTARRARELLLQGETPPARREKKCDSCSLLEICKPDAGTKSARRYFEQAVLQSLTSDQGEALD